MCPMFPLVALGLSSLPAAMKSKRSLDLRKEAPGTYEVAPQVKLSGRKSESKAHQLGKVEHGNIVPPAGHPACFSLVHVQADVA